MKILLFCFCSLLLAFPKALSAETAKQYFLDRKPFIHPAIIRDLSSFVSDSGDQVISINLPDSQGSNRYFGDVKVSDEKVGSASVCYDVNKDENQWFCYSYVGILEKDVFVVQTIESSGGTGQFTDLLFVSFETRKNLRFGKEKRLLSQDKELYLINRLGSLSLGDRFVASELKIENNKIYIGKDIGWFSQSGGTGGDDNITQDQDIVIDVKMGELE